MSKVMIGNGLNGIASILEEDYIIGANFARTNVTFTQKDYVVDVYVKYVGIVTYNFSNELEAYNMIKYVKNIIDNRK